MEKQNPRKHHQFSIWKEGRYFVSQCLDVDVASFGKTRKNALSNLNEALELYYQE